MSMTAGQRWSIGKPTVPGWYWWRLAQGTDVEMVMVFTQGLHLRARIYGYTPEKRPCKISQTGGEWQGPITPHDQEAG